jgi:hypothetical protein
MSDERQWKLDGAAKAHRWAVLCGMFAIAALSTTTCGVAGPTIDGCEFAADCGEKPGTVCSDEFCMCPDPGDLFCGGACRPFVECMGGGSGGTGGSGSGGTCTTAADCPQPGDPHCGTATCEGGSCSLNLRPFSKLKSQVRGDCKNLWCDGDGNLIELEDASDTYNDGAQCSFNICEAGQPQNTPYPSGAPCPETGAGVCFETACVMCIDNLVYCGGGFACDGVRCVQMHCVNDQWDQGLGETAKNCGGPCRPCDEGDACKISTDCLHGVCVGGACAPPTCSDKVKNDNETGIDCGGPPSCSRCPTGQGCKLGSDCESGVCWAGVCEAPRCDDGILNGDETEWDCGGSCGPCP